MDHSLRNLVTNTIHHEFIYLSYWFLMLILLGSQSDETGIQIMPLLSATLF